MMVSDHGYYQWSNTCGYVLILVLVDDGLWLARLFLTDYASYVLILVLVDDGLWQKTAEAIAPSVVS